jgi:hypothetical protein
LQSIDFFPRFLLYAGSLSLSDVYGIGTPIDFLSNSGNNGWGAAFLASFVVLFLWIAIINLWNKINFALSFDWFFALFRAFLYGQKINWKDPMHSRDILNNFQSIFKEENPPIYSIKSK